MQYATVRSDSTQWCATAVRSSAEQYGAARSNGVEQYGQYAAVRISIIEPHGVVLSVSFLFLSCPSLSRHVLPSHSLSFGAPAANARRPRLLSGLMSYALSGLISFFDDLREARDGSHHPKSTQRAPQEHPKSTPTTPHQASFHGIRAIPTTVPSPGHYRRSGRGPTTANP